MQLPPLLFQLHSNPWEVFPSVPYVHTRACASTQNTPTQNTHTLARTSLFAFLSALSACRPLSVLHDNTTVLQLPNLLLNSAYSAKPICFCTNHLLILFAQSPPSHHGSFKSHISYSSPPHVPNKRGKLLLAILAFELIYQVVVRGDSASYFKTQTPQTMSTIVSLIFSVLFVYVFIGFCGNKVIICHYADPCFGWLFQE